MRSVIPAACLVLICLCVTNTVFAEEVTVLFDGSDAAAWDTARDRDRLNREFSLSELSQIEGPALRWRFISRGISFNDIFLRRPVPRGFDKIRVQVRNAGANVRRRRMDRESGGRQGWRGPAVDRVPVG